MNSTCGDSVLEAAGRQGKHVVEHSWCGERGTSYAERYAGERVLHEVKMTIVMPLYDQHTKALKSSPLLVADQGL